MYFFCAGLAFWHENGAPTIVFISWTNHRPSLGARQHNLYSSMMNHDAEDKHLAPQKRIVAITKRNARLLTIIFPADHVGFGGFRESAEVYDWPQSWPQIQWSNLYRCWDACRRLAFFGVVPVVMCRKVKRSWWEPGENKLLCKYGWSANKNFRSILMYFSFVETAN